MEIKEVKCKSIMSDSKLYGVDYSINPYIGCEHGCRYCYATYMKNYSNHPEPWGEFIDIKKNSPRVLHNDLMDKEQGSVLLSSVTDPYQPIEEKYELTRNILERLANTRFPVSILTKSDLIVRDLDILKKFNPDRISVGFTLNYLKDRDRKVWEPNASSIPERLEALKKISNSGIDCYVHIGPYFEGITDLEAISEKVQNYISELQIESLTLRGRSREIMDTIDENYPELSRKYNEIRTDSTSYKSKLENMVEKIRKEYDLVISLFL